MFILALAVQGTANTDSDIMNEKLIERVKAAITNGQQNLREYRTDEQYWNYYAHLGPHLTSLFYLVCKSVGRTDVFSADDIESLKQKLLKEQHENGSWHAVIDKNLQQGEDRAGDILPSIYNYLGLKVMGVDPNSPVMIKARDFIVSKGGIEKAPLFCKIFMALFNNYPWNKATMKIPYLVFSDSALLKSINVENFAQWIGPHLRPIAYLRQFQVAANVDQDKQKSQLRELYANPQLYDSMKTNVLTPSARSSFQKLVDQLLINQQPQGSWGGYTLSTMLAVIALEHYKKSCTNANKLKAIEKSLDKSYDFLKMRYLEKGKDGYLQGGVMDGRVWDTSLCTRAFIHSGVNQSEVQKTIDFLVNFQIKGGEGDGGISYGYDFEYAPDVDDTSEYVLALHAFGGHKEEIKRGIHWVEKMQNKDGGFAAFQKDKAGNWLLRKATKGYDDSAELFDVSCPDLTGHALEALGSQGYNSNNSQVVRKAINYLKREVQDYPAWWARWGINYIYGTSAAVVGLVAVGEDPKQQYIQNSINWLKQRQNADGGFGEGTESYLTRDAAGKGISTPSQTAWALQALVSTGHGKSIEAQKAVQYLVNEMETKGKWVDQSTVGTGHPGIIYMNYPAYPGAWSLSALVQYVCDASTQDGEQFCKNLHPK